MPLNIEVPVEHPDVTALKKKVVEVADRYTRTHGWCDVVNQALREMGVKGTEGPRTIRVEVTFKVNGGEEQTAVQRFDRDVLVKKGTPEQQNAWVAQMLTPPPTAVLGVTIPAPTVEVIDLNLANRGAAGLDYPDGFIHFFTSNEGRVAHLIRDPNREDTERWLSRGAHYALCGASSFAGTQNSARSEDRVCKKCLERTS